jgi:hypothetical protein
MTPPFFARRPRARPLLLLAIAGLCGCVTLAEPPDPSLGVGAGLAMLGSVERVLEAPIESGDRTAGGEEPWRPLEVVVIRDRHSVHGAITRERGPITEVRRENRAAVGFLLSKGFTLLGCESPFGPLPRDDGPSSRHREAIQRAIRQSDRLDSLSVYQPIRYEEELEGRLIVLGVEDPGLYGADVARLNRILELQSVAARADTAGVTRQAAVKEVVRLIRTISASARLRGRIAACNLVHLMETQRVERAVLLIGGAHAAGAMAALEEHGVETWVFTCRSYDAGRHPTR